MENVIVKRTSGSNQACYFLLLLLSLCSIVPVLYTFLLQEMYSIKTDRTLNSGPNATVFSKHKTVKTNQHKS